MNIKPTQDRVAVKRINKDETNIPGMFIPEGALSESNIAEVVAVGPGTRNEDGSYQAIDVKVGDAVIIARHAGVTLTTDEGEEILVLRADEIYAVCE